jgi:ABC-2 type transport system ATP-binding protein
MSIRVEQVTKLYGTQKAVDEASFSMNKGEVVGLLGPNGAGKSTLMKILTCFIPPTSGKAFVMEYDVQEHPLEVQRLVGYLPEHNPLYLDMYVREYLGFIAGIHQLGSKTAQRVRKSVHFQKGTANVWAWPRHSSTTLRCLSLTNQLRASTPISWPISGN